MSPIPYCLVVDFQTILFLQSWLKCNGSHVWLLLQQWYSSFCNPGLGGHCALYSTSRCTTIFASVYLHPDTIISRCSSSNNPGASCWFCNNLLLICRFESLTNGWPLTPTARDEWQNARRSTSTPAVLRRLCSSPFESLCWFINNRGLDGASVTAAKLAELIIEEGELTVGVEARLHVGVLCPSKAKSRDDFQRKYYYSVEKQNESTCACFDF